MSPKASELHSSKLHSWGTEPSQGPDAASLLGGTEEIRNLTEFISGWRKKKSTNRASDLGSVRFTPPLCQTSICGFHLCRLSNLSDIYRLHHPRCASPAVVWRTKDARHRRKGLIVNMIIPSDAVISFVSEWHARAHPHRNIWDLFCFFFNFGEKVRNSSQF